jgi:hypothetical protein
VKKILFLTIPMAMMMAARAQEGAIPLEDAEQKKLIADVIEKAHQYAKDLPNFACAQVTRKNLDPTGTSRHWKLTETVHEELVYKDGKQEYTENGKKSGGENRPNGLMAASEFAEVINWIFDPKAQGLFQWSKSDSLRGHRTQTIAYSVTKENSQFMVGKKSPFQAPFAGLIEVDADTEQILKINVVAYGLPKNFPVSAISKEFHYDYTKIGDHFYLLPLKADLQSKEGKSLMWNEVEFREYRKP